MKLENCGEGNTPHFITSHALACKSCLLQNAVMRKDCPTPRGPA